MDGEDGSPIAGSALTPSRRPRIRTVVLAAVVVLLIGAAGSALAAVSTSARSPSRVGASAARSTAPSVASAAPTAVAPPTSLDGSDVFSGWSISDPEGSIRMVGTLERHGGSAALLITRPDGSTGGGAATLSQTVTVPQASTVVLSFWASSDGAAAAGAVQVRIGSSAPAVAGLPGGAFGWTRFTTSWTVPAGVTSVPVAVVVTAPTSGTRVDDVVLQGQGSRGVSLDDGDFETTSATVLITDASLVRRSSDSVHLVSRLVPEGRFSWSAQEYTGGAPITGKGRFVAGAASLPLAAVPSGYYRLVLRVPVDGRVVERSTDLVVTTDRPAAGPSPVLGVGVHLGPADGQLTQKVGDLAALGFRAARLDADWGTIERSAGVYDFSSLDPVVAALQHVGLRPLLIADYRNALYDGGRTPSTPGGIAAYARFAAAVAAHFPDADIDVYNEYDFRLNNGACGTTPACYLQLLRPTATAVRAVGSTAAITGPDIAGIGVQQPWLQGFIDGGGLDSVDALDFHPYVQPDRPEVLDAQLTALQASLDARGAGAKPIWFTEFGTATVPGWATERQQAEDVARVFGVAAAHRVGRIYWYDSIDDGPDPTNREHRFGLFRAATFLAPAAYVPKPAAAVIAATVRIAAGGAFVSDETVDGRRSVRLEGASLLWAPDGDGSASVRATAAHGVVSMTGRRVGIGTSLTVGSSPVWVVKPD